MATHELAVLLFAVQHFLDILLRFLREQMQLLP